MVNLKYSKPTDFYLKSKKKFFDNNLELLNQIRKVRDLYKKQPKRKLCKLCENKLSSSVDFTSHGIEYSFCDKCNHLNGMYDDTIDFVNALYIENDGDNYSKNYIDNKYNERMNDVYVPKIKFLIENIPDNEKKTLLDIGCGSGYFVCAALSNGIDAFGIDVSRAMVEFGNSQIKHNIDMEPLKFCNEKDFFDDILMTEQNIISAVGVIEHLREPQKFFEAFKKSKANYLFYSVPMFSYSVILENMLTNVFPRQLSGGHTHLFTENSILQLDYQLNSSPIAQWRFGSDAMDIYRSSVIKIKENNCSEKFHSDFSETFLSMIDKLQNIFDESHYCSEIHSLVSKKN